MAVSTTWETNMTWQDAATRNATKGLPWAVWGSRDGGPLILLDSKATQQEAETFATYERMHLRGDWEIYLTNLENVV